MDDTTIEYLFKPWHPGQSLRCKSFDFMPSDSREIFEMNLQVPEYREYFRQQGWIEAGAITYEINSEGFRGREFDTNADNLVALGCSYTMGIGLPWHCLWPTLVGQRLGLSVCNLSWGGISADTCYRLAEYWVPALRPRLVVMLTPPLNRFELHTTSDSIPVENFMPNCESVNWDDVKPFLRHYWTANQNSDINRRKNQWALRGLCHDLGIPCLIYNCETWMGRRREDVGYARDRLHGGPPAHRMIAETVEHDYAAIK